MKILIFGKRGFTKFMLYNNIDDSNVESQDIMIISINSAINRELLFDAQTTVQSHFKRQHSNVMIMHFGDYSEEFVNKIEHEGPTGIFNDYKAQKLYRFIKANKHKKTAIVHCGAGISRSGAIGSFIYDLYGKDDMTWDEFKRKNPQIQPNTHILKLLRKVYEKDKQ
jgi:predicted protein tyrosine phosphatase